MFPRDDAAKWVVKLVVPIEGSKRNGISIFTEIDSVELNYGFLNKSRSLCTLNSESFTKRAKVSFLVFFIKFYI